MSKLSSQLYWQRCVDNPECKERHKQNGQRTRQGYKENGLCSRCGKPAMPGRSLCAFHRFADKMRAWLRKCTAIYLLGGACTTCGQTDVRILEFDHKNNDGAQHRKQSGITSGKGTVDWILNHQQEARKRIQVLCANCHAYKQYERSMS